VIAGGVDPAMGDEPRSGPRPAHPRSWTPPSAMSNKHLFVSRQGMKTFGRASRVDMHPGRRPASETGPPAAMPMPSGRIVAALTCGSVAAATNAPPTWRLTPPGNPARLGPPRRSAVGHHVVRIAARPRRPLPRAHPTHTTNNRSFVMLQPRAPSPAAPEASERIEHAVRGRRAMC
jgi:hypothetical protein